MSKAGPACICIQSGWRGEVFPPGHPSRPKLMGRARRNPLIWLRPAQSRGTGKVLPTLLPLRPPARPSTGLSCS